MAQAPALTAEIVTFVGDPLSPENMTELEARALAPSAGGTNARLRPGDQR